ncbi:MAG TPA: Re/Si-specific NAD(P)(+) transhydrogenase subunit alpha [Acidimicrobiales bacterium]|nr:Re/Si-specific NAD(P)(+) transhydrogenase subunit alpha [Acidimicrobiales bacterium]
MRVAVQRETADGERRVALVPDVAERLIRAGHEVIVESGAGAGALYGDAAYEAKGASVVPTAGEAAARAEVLCRVLPPSVEDIARLPGGAATVSFLQPGQQLELVRALVAGNVTAFSLDLLPRISRAQSMDALSSQSTVSGYRGALLAAERLHKFFPMFMTAAGTVPPAKVLVMGAGVAGLQAIATARRLGAVVRAYDVRPAAKDEVKSLGATFVELPLETQEGAGGYAKEQSEDFLRRQRELILAEVAASDAVITTAAIPGRKAPVLVTTEMVEAMSPGSVVVDLAAESGGNCELSRPGEDVVHGEVLVIGVKNLTSTMAIHASFLYSRNVAEFVGLLSKDGALAPDFDDEVVAGSCVTHAGEIRHAPTRESIEAGAGVS